MQLLLRHSRSHRLSGGHGTDAPSFAAPNLAAHDFENGSVFINGSSAPFTDPYQDGRIDVVDDPTSIRGGKVLRMHYSPPGDGLDMNRSILYQHTFSFGDEFWFRGYFYLPQLTSFAGDLRKLIYWQGSGTNTNYAISVVRGNGFLSEESGSNGSSGGTHTDNSIGPQLVAGQWYRLEKRCKMNSSAGVIDGEITVWLDGTSILNRSDYCFLPASNDTIHDFLIGDQLQTTPVTDEYRYWDNVAFSTAGRIGP